MSCSIAPGVLSKEAMSPLSLDLGWFEAALNVTDIERSRAFYETLGFQPASGVA